jgi:hypothetical protein
MISKDFILNAVYRQIEAANLSKRMGGHYKCHLAIAERYLEYHLGDLTPKWRRTIEASLRLERYVINLPRESSTG